MCAQPKIKWHKVFASEEGAKNAVAEGSIVKVMLGNKFVCFSRSKNQFFAFGDSCPHQGKPLIQAKCNEHQQVVCPFHQYKFDLNTGRGHGLYLPVYKVEVKEDGVFVGEERSPWQIF